MNVTRCSSDFDCPGTLVCYENVTWAVEDNIVCGCGFYYGWHGDLCEDFGTQTYLSLCFNALIILVAVVGVFRGMATLYELVKHHKEGKLWNASNITALFGTLALVFITFWRSQAIAVLVTPQNADHLVESNPDTKYHELTVLDRVGVTLSTMFSVLAALNISLMWIEVANSSSRIRRRISNSFSCYKVTIYVFESLFSVVMIVLMANNMPDFAVLAAYPFILFIIVTFSIGQVKMKRLLDSMATSGMSSSEPAASPAIADSEASTKKPTLFRLQSAFSKSMKGSSTRATASAENSNTKKYKEMIRLIQRTARLTVIFLVFAALSGGAYAYMSISGWREFVSPQGISLITLMNDIMNLFILLAVATIQWYCYQNMKTTLRRVKGRDGGFSSSDRSKDESFSRTGTYSKGTAQVQSFQNLDKFQVGAKSFHEPERFSQGSETDFV